MMTFWYFSDIKALNSSSFYIKWFISLVWYLVGFVILQILIPCENW